MLKRTVLLALVVITMALIGGCTKPTKLTGKLILQTGQSGDVQNCKVQLYVSSDLTGSPVKEVASQQNTAVNSPFEFTDVVEGYYYLIAWKDLNGDGVVSDKDIVGIHGGTYTPGHGGSQVSVITGKTTDVGEIVMLIFKQLKITTTGTRYDDNQYTEFSYSFNHNVTLNSLTVNWPGSGSDPDQYAPGAKTAGTLYYSNWYGGGGSMPTGDHVLNFKGDDEGTSFDVNVVVTVN